MSYVPVETISCFIKELVDRGFTLKEISYISGIRAETISRWKNCKWGSIRFREAEMLTTSFGYHIGEVWPGYWEGMFDHVA